MARLLTLVGALSACGLAQAAPFQNGSFEVASLNPGTFTTLGLNNSQITGWTVSGGNIDYIGTYWQAANGSRSIDLAGNTLGTISQTFDTNIGWVYTVDFAMAGNTDGGPTTKLLQVVAGDEQGQFSFNQSGRSRSNMGWLDYSFQFTADTAQTILSFSALNGTCCYGAALDNVRVTAEPSAVPEPASALLVGLSLAGLGWSRRNRRQGTP
ncbi:MAG TPA: PEP-CTERM sorting domain-containing protein [Candidatus Accumulibacter sp.]|nr:PEP-CTERM sorting domain-containing protein [Accumulibacter sp.]HCV13413.1 PEP-CTERM sorting domain-containing protein [Accumulibacter sp.]